MTGNGSSGNQGHKERENMSEEGKARTSKKSKLTLAKIAAGLVGRRWAAWRRGRSGWP